MEVMDKVKFMYVWCVEYPCRGYWDIKIVKNYYHDLNQAQEFVDNYDKLSIKNAYDVGPCKYYGNSIFKPKAERYLAIHVDNETHVVGTPILFS